MENRPLIKRFRFLWAGLDPSLSIILIGLVVVGNIIFLSASSGTVVTWVEQARNLLLALVIMWVTSRIPVKWLEKIASTFHGNIKIEKANQSDERPLQPIADALEAQDLKLAYSFAKNIQIQSVGLWAKHVAERLSLEEDYSSFAEKVQNWVQHPPIENKIAPIKTTQENIP